MIRRIFNLKFFLVLFLLCIYARELVFTAWLGDDCAITFRTVLNFTHGYGARFNIIDRVQTYTHPLWFLVLSLFNSIIFKDTIFVLYFSCFLFSILTFLIFCLFNKNKTCIQILLLSLIFFSSKCFIDYSTSGLENPLSHFLILCIFITSTKIYSSPTKKNFSWFVFLSSLLLITRQDFLILILPLGICTLYNAYKKLSIKNLLILSIIFSFPIYCWLAFSIIYYGFPFPNTAYAKLVTDIDIVEATTRGKNYILETFLNDKITFAVIFIPMFLTIKKSNISLAVFYGILLYFAYILWIGGDFMGGRFFSTPFILSLANISFIISNKYKKSSCIALVTIFVLFGLQNIDRTIFTNKILTDAKSTIPQINDERGMYQYEHNLYDYGKYALNSIKWNYDKNKEIKVIKTERLGWFSIHEGVNTHIFDIFALCDAFLSHIKGDSNFAENGHYSRQIPDNYEENLLTDNNPFTDGKDKELYDLILLATRAPLFSKERFRAIYLLNTKNFN